MAIMIGEIREDVGFTDDLKSKAHRFSKNNQNILSQPRKKFLEKAKENTKYNFRRYFGIHIFNFNPDIGNDVDHKGAVEFTKDWFENAKRLVGG